MRKNDPKYEITSEVRAALMQAVFETGAGKAVLALLPQAGEHADVLRRKKTGYFQPSSGFDEAKADEVSKRALEGLINDMAALRADYYKAIDHGNPQKLQDVLAKGFPVNFCNPHTGETALHRLAASGARAAIRVLLAHEDCNFLIRDNQGRLPSELAYLYGRDPALARLLGNKERKQGEAQGIKVTRRPVP